MKEFKKLLRSMLTRAWKTAQAIDQKMLGLSSLCVESCFIFIAFPGTDKMESIAWVQLSNYPGFLKKVKCCAY